MAFNFPQSPTIDQESVQNGIRYKWTGVKWKRLDTASNPQVTEYADVGFYSGNNVVLDTARYNYHKIELTGNTSISAPNLSLYSSNTIEIKRPFYSDQAYSLTAASYNNVATSITDTAPYTIVFKPDGTKAYYMGGSGKIIYELRLAIPWVISSYYAVVQSVSLSTVAANPQGLALDSTGTKVYITNVSGSQILQHNVSTAWDISTMSGSTSLATNSGTNVRTISFNPTGTLAYWLANGILYQYALSTAWAINTAVYNNVSVTLSGQDSNITCIYFHHDGTKFFILGGTNKTVYQYNMPTPWSLSGATYSGISYYVGGTVTNPYSVAFADSGTRMYIGGNNGTSGFIYQYSSYATPDISINWPTDVKWEAGSAPSINSGQTSLINLTNFGDGKIIGNSLSLSLGKT